MKYDNYVIEDYKDSLKEFQSKNANIIFGSDEMENYIESKSEENIEYYEVLTDGERLWVSLDNLIKVCRGFSAEQLSSFYLNPDNDVVFGEQYVAVEERLLKFIKENTHNPNYVAKLSLLMRKQKVADNDYDPDHGRENIAMGIARRVDGATEVVLGPERKFR